MKKLFKLGTNLTRDELKTINGGKSQNLSKCRYPDGTWVTKVFDEKWQAMAENERCSAAGGQYVVY